MMTYIIPMFMIMNMWIVTNSNNPMKTSFFILTTAGLMFFMTTVYTNMVWLPMIFFILFTGGILMMFMILASVLPNEKTMKIKYSKIMTLIFMIMLWPMMKMNEMNLISNLMKGFISSGTNLIFMMGIILIYFFSSININSMENTSMRSLMC